MFIYKFAFVYKLCYIKVKGCTVTDWSVYLFQIWVARLQEDENVSTRVWNLGFNFLEMSMTLGQWVGILKNFIVTECALEN